MPFPLRSFYPPGSKQASLLLVRRGSKRTVTKKCRSERKERCNFDTALHYNTVEMIATEGTRTAKPAVRATGSPIPT